MRISDWSSDVCSSDLLKGCIAGRAAAAACGRRASPTPGSPTRHATPEAMVYAVKEIFLTLQGEGAQAGRRAVFCRFAGCNLWTGREKDRAKAVCQFCDPAFVGTDGTLCGKHPSAAALPHGIPAHWGEGRQDRHFVPT